jgi:hypothetical protein
VLIPETVLESNKDGNQDTDFWRHILRDEELRQCDSLQKLLAGCEIIAALDSVDLLGT